MLVEALKKELEYFTYQHNIMPKCIVLISIIISASCVPISYGPTGGPEEPITDCKLGPFKETITKCLRLNKMLNRCILQDLGNWFHINDTLNVKRILFTVTSYVKEMSYLKQVSELFIFCVDKGNLQGPNKLNETADEFIKCLNGKNAFADLFPRAFCKEKPDNESSDKLSPSEEDPDYYDYDDDETTETNEFSHCELGPFTHNAKRCLTLNRTNGIYARCLLYHSKYYMKNNKLNVTKLLESIHPYIINEEYEKPIGAVMAKCVTEANALQGRKGGRNGVGHGLVKCWHLENIFSLFRSAFCPI